MSASSMLGTKACEGATRALGNWRAQLERSSPLRLWQGEHHAQLGLGQLLQQLGTLRGGHRGESSRLLAIGTIVRFPHARNPRPDVHAVIIAAATAQLTGSGAGRADHGLQTPAISRYFAQPAAHSAKSASRPQGPGAFDGRPRWCKRTLA
jgi:hypothetical protein